MISEDDIVALDQIIREMEAQTGPHPWMATVAADLQQIRDHIEGSLNAAAFAVSE